MQACREATGIKAFGETSADGLFTMTEVECLGACVNAPILQVDDDFYEDMDAERDQGSARGVARAASAPPPGSMTGRQTSAPEGGPTTLTTLHFADRRELRRCWRTRIASSPISTACTTRC